LRNYDNARNNDGINGPGYFDHPTGHNHDYYQYVNDWLKLHAGHEYSEDAVRTLTKHAQMIDRCFWPNSVEEIMDNLRKESHPYAKTIL